ncbi:MAG: type II 3-dehydroquinate dehydratase [Candidatus Nanopelagicales bacterium]
MNKKIVIINGPNLGRLGKRQPEIYGSQTIKDLHNHCHEVAKDLGVEVSTFQTDSLDEVISFIKQAESESADIILNAGSFTHYSYELANIVADLAVTVIEVHISNLSKREEFRKKSVLAPVVKGSIAGFGFDSYTLALTYLARKSL